MMMPSSHSAVTITAIETVPLHLPLRGLRAGGRLSLGVDAGVAPRHHLLLQVKLSDGSLGSAELVPQPARYGETVTGARAIVAELLQPQLVGASVADALARLEHLPPQHSASKAALDIALQDAQARSQGSSLWQQLVPSLASPLVVPVAYVVGWQEQHESIGQQVGHRAQAGGLEPLFAEVEQIVQQGIRWFTLQMGHDIAATCSCLQLLSESFPEARWQVDAGAKLDPLQARSQLSQLQAAGACYVIDPLPWHHLTQVARLRGSDVVSIVSQWAGLSPQHLALALRLKALDIVSISPSRSGFQQSLTMMRQAQEAGCAVTIDSGGASGLGTLHAAMLAAHVAQGLEDASQCLPCELSYPLKFSSDSISPSLHYQEGGLEVFALSSDSPKLAPLPNHGLRTD